MSDKIELMDPWRLIAERKIREAMEDGVFEHLDGAGQPLDLTENPYEDPSLRMAHKVLKNNGFAPAWIEEGKEIDRLCAGLENAPPEKRAEMNRRIAVYNLKLPPGCPPKRPLKL